MKLNIGAKFEEKLTCTFKNDMSNLADFQQSTRKSQNRTFMRSFYSNQKMYGLEIYRRVMS